jgi:REP element-mobilizing transposase RayT
MARKPRIDTVGVLYHVITRGNNRLVLFRSDADWDRYLAILADAQRRFAIRLYAYVLMPNHVHLLLELTAGKLARCLQVIQQRYAQYVNRKYRRVGHLYQGRYRAIVCERDRFLFALIRYLHLNPVRAGLVQDPAEYPWSSHTAYLGRQLSSVSLTTGLVLGALDPKIAKARRAYARFIKEGLGAGHAPEFYEVQEQQILGSERFAENISLSRGASSRKRGKVALGLEELMVRVSRATRVPAALIKGRGRAEQVYAARALFCYAATRVAGLSARRVAEAIGRDPSNTTRAVAWVERMNTRERNKLLQRVFGQE